MAKFGNIDSASLDAKVDKVTGKSLISDTEITRLAAVDNYTHPASHPASMITPDSSNQFVSAAEKAAYAAKAVPADITSAISSASANYATAAQGGKADSAYLAAVTNATNSNTASAIVKRDSGGNFAAGTIAASLNGNASTATSAGNVTGTVAVANGGTGATDATTARSNLGVTTLLSSKADLVDGRVPSNQLPGPVPEIITAVNLAAIQALTGTTDAIYVAADTNVIYRWSGSAYVEISASLALGETSSTAYRGDRGKTAYDHSQATGNTHNLTPTILGLGNVENKSSATIRGEITSGNVTTALGFTPATATQGGKADTALQAASNLSDLASVSTARTNLGLGTAATTASSAYATAAQGTKADSAVQPSDLAAYATDADVTAAISAAASSYATSAQGTKADSALQAASNLSDLASASAARTNLGLGTAATTASTAYATATQGGKADGALQAASNLSDVANAATARTNLGLGTAATTASTAYATSAQGAKADSALQAAALDGYATTSAVTTAISTASANYATAAQGTKADSALQSSVIDTDSTMAANSDTKVPSQKAVKAAIAAQGSSLQLGETSTTAYAGDKGAALKTTVDAATNANTAGAIVKRDASGNFTAGVITAALTGNVTGNCSGSAGSCTGNAATATSATSAGRAAHLDASTWDTGKLLYVGDYNTTSKLDSPNGDNTGYFLKCTNPGGPPEPFPSFSWVKMLATDIPTLNQSTTGNAATASTAEAVTNATLTTALTVDTGSVALKGNAANTSALTLAAGASSVGGSNTGDVTLAATSGLSLSGQVLSMGTPSTITTATANAATASSHTHAITPALGMVGVGTAANQVAVTGASPYTPAWTAATGTGSPVLATSPTLVTPALGTPSSGNLANCTFPVLNQNTSGTAAGLSSTLAISSGGTGATTAAEALENLGHVGYSQTVSITSGVTLSPSTHNCKTLLVSHTSSTPLYVTIPETESFPVGGEIAIIQTNTGKVEVLAQSSSVFVNGVGGGRNQITSQYGLLVLKKINVQAWICVGNFTEVE